MIWNLKDATVVFRTKKSVSNMINWMTCEIDDHYSYTDDKLWDAYNKLTTLRTTSYRGPVYDTLHTDYDI